MNTEPLDPIQMLWVRGDFSRMELLSMRSFLSNGHPVHLYTYEPASNIPNGVTVMDASEIVAVELAPSQTVQPFGKGSMGSFSDYFRYNLLKVRGGWWSDMDIVCTRPWAFEAKALTASTCEKDYGQIANTCVMRFPPDHPLMNCCCSAFKNWNLQELDINQTGPLLLHEKMSELDLRHLSVAPDVFCPIPWNASWQLLRPWWKRFGLDELKQRIRRPHLNMHFSRATVAVHLWHETWRYEGWNKHNVYSPGCLYEKLQRQWNP